MAGQVVNTNVDLAIDLYEKAIQRDSEFATAYAWLGSIKRGLDSNPDALKAVQIARPYYEKALQIDPENYAAHKVKGQSHLWYEWNFEEADKEYQFLKRRYPNSFILPALLLSTGRFKEALENSKRNFDTDPLNPFTLSYYILSLYYNGQKDQLLETIPNALTLEGLQNQRGRDFLINRIAEVYQFLGRYQESSRTCENYFGDTNNPRMLAIQAINYLHLQQPHKTMEILQNIKLMAADSGQSNTTFSIAIIYAQMEETDLAFEWLEKAYQKHEQDMYWLKVYPSFAPLYNDPRWQEMLDKVGFPE
jgi:tetratricopeptide (TPR) repeat protein